MFIYSPRWNPCENFFSLSHEDNLSFLQFSCMVYFDDMFNKHKTFNSFTASIFMRIKELIEGTACTRKIELYNTLFK